MEIGFSLGSNLGDRMEHLVDAKARILQVPDTQFVAQSPLYDTEPVGVDQQYQEMTFLNAVLIVESPRDVRAWLESVGTIEKDLGRVRDGDRYGPRTVDIDILYAGDQIIDSGGLTVPHPRWAERRFVVQPLSDVRPGLVLPGAGKKVSDILDTLEGEQIRLFTTEW